MGLTHLYYICFLSGLFITSAVYCALHFIFPVKKINDFLDSASPAETLMREYRERWDEEGDEVDIVETTKA